MFALRMTMIIFKIVLQPKDPFLIFNLIPLTLQIFFILVSSESVHQDVLCTF